MPGLLVVSIRNSDFKAVNRLLSYIRDWEFGNGADCFKVLHTIDDAADARRANNDEATVPPMTDFSDNEWQGLSIDQVEKHMLAQSDGDSGNTNLFFLLDDQGVRDGTVIVAERVVSLPEDDDEPIEYPKEFNKVRMPWIQAYSMWANLNIANMEFDAYCEEEYPDVPEDRWWTFQDMMGEGYYDQYVERAEKAIAELKESNQA